MLFPLRAEKEPKAEACRQSHAAHRSQRDPTHGEGFQELSCQHFPQWPFIWRAFCMRIIRLWVCDGGGGGRIFRDQMKHWVKTNLWGHLGLRGFPGGSDGKESACQCRRLGCDPWVGKIPWRKKWSPSPQYSCLEEQGKGRRSLAGYSPWGRKRVAHD